MDNLTSRSWLTRTIQNESHAGSEQQCSGDTTRSYSPVPPAAAPAWETLILIGLHPSFLNGTNRNLFMHLDFGVQKLHEKRQPSPAMIA